MSFARLIIGALGMAMLAGCGPSVERAYAKCAEVAYKQAIANNKAALPKDLAGIYEKAARATAEKQCGFIREECNRDPQSATCQRLVQQYGN